MKRKGLFIAFDDLTYNPNIINDTNPSGINGLEKKIFYQFNTFEEYGFEMSFYNPCLNRNSSIEKFTRRLPFHFLTKWDFDFNTIRNFSFIYIRKAWFMDGDLILALKKIRKISPNITIFLEIPTYPYDHEGKGVKMLPLKIKDKFWRKHLFKYVDRIVTYSDDDNIFNVPTIRLSNAIDYELVKRKNILNNVSDTFNIIAVSSLYYWHGYDRAIEGLKNYYANTQHIKELNLYIVGTGPEFDRYKELIEKYCLENHVFLTGYKSGDDLEKIYDKCIIGLDSMGRHRSGVLFNSSLKGKEYCAKGLMIVSGVKTELDLDSNFQYYMRVPADDTPLDFTKIANQVQKYLSCNNISDIQTKIMEYSKDNFDYSVALKPILNYINNHN
ncbi:uncharacterized protein BN628_00449 [Ligilactobacillus ruminis CAG:367]|nr:uncharacterized protein BN628_00449 [Ligilactobacillus ruminis CAG:367]